MSDGGSTVASGVVDFGEALEKNVSCIGMLQIDHAPQHLKIIPW